MVKLRSHYIWFADSFLGRISYAGYSSIDTTKKGIFLGWIAFHGFTPLIFFTFLFLSSSKHAAKQTTFATHVPQLKLNRFFNRLSKSCCFTLMVKRARKRNVIYNQDGLIRRAGTCLPLALRARWIIDCKKEEERENSSGGKILHDNWKLT